ncbi:MAG: arginine--tRNA ligase [Candidatus Blackburnbacteria bacterium]|nr:arginine--tRNA ligase [Candidatus Blackburnbacteria bacterium]
MREQLGNAIAKVVKELTVRDVEPKLEHPAQEEFGDYSTSVALAVISSGSGKSRGDLSSRTPRDDKRSTVTTKWSSPLEFAEKIKEKLEESKMLKGLVEKIDVVAPGFINFWLSKEMLVGEMGKVGELGGSYGSSNVFDGQTVVVDYSGPNIAKPFGIGHLRSTIIGQAIYNLYKFLGAHTVGDNHLGDWGRQFGVLLHKITSGKLNVDGLTIDDLEKLYVEFHKEVEENPALWDEARGWFKKLEDGDPGAREIWQKVKDISLTEFSRIYDLLGVTIDYVYGESFYEKLMPEVVEECKVRGIAKESEGALIVEFEDLPPAILVKSDGATNYFTRDLATIKFRLKEWDPDLILYEVGAEQALHFQQLFEAVRLLGWGGLSPSSERVVPTRFVHIKHGLYLAPSGKKFSTRKGDTIHLEEVLEEAITRAGYLIRGGSRGKTGLELPLSKHPSVSESKFATKVRPEEEVQRDIDNIAKQVGVGAVKYFDLSHHPSSNIVFDWDKIMALEGNSAPYLQYTYARCKSVLTRAADVSSRVEDERSLTLVRDDIMEPEELAVLRTLYKFPEVVEEAARNYAPNIICNYVNDLAQKYNAFYNQHRILPGDGSMSSWLDQDHSDLKTGLNLLGIEAPERM